MPSSSTNNPVPSTWHSFWPPGGTCDALQKRLDIPDSAGVKLMPSVEYAVPQPPEPYLIICD